MTTDPLPWSMVLHDDVPRWLSGFRGLFAKYGHDMDDVAQEGRLALVEQEAYLKKLQAEGGRAAGAARILVMRTVYRRLMGRAKEGKAVLDTGPNGWELIFAAESREHSAHLQLELAEAVAAAPSDVRMYLRALLQDGPVAINALTDKVHRAAADYLLSWFVDRHNWRHES